MIEQEYSVIGVMSGTSLDGIDLVYVKFSYDNAHWCFKIICSETINYDTKWRHTLEELVLCATDELKQVDTEYTAYLATIIKDFIVKNNIKHIDAIYSHGHTALHQPDKKLTYQIGNKPDLAKLLDELVVCDFRVQDVELGGQGAPLVPIGDELLFADYVFCLNLGGFANISTKMNAKRIAFDICPVNIVLNHYVKPLGIDYDAAGKIASTGKVDDVLFENLNTLYFYKKPYPKSLGIEWVNTHIFPLIDSFNLEIKDVLRTFVEHIAFQIANATVHKNKVSVFISGGGAYNEFLVERLKSLSDNNFVVPSNDIVEFKEALVFGLLGVLKLRNEINCLKSVTGASKDHSTGKIFHP